MTETAERWVMRVVGVAGYGYAEALEVPENAWLAEVDYEYGGGRGMARLTDNVEEAMVFPSAMAVHAAWTTVPESRPLRPDGKPNRPLTAYTITAERA